MSENNDFNTLLEKVYDKLDSINYFDESDLAEINNNITKLTESISAIGNAESFEAIHTRLDEFEVNNDDFKNSLIKIVENIAGEHQGGLEVDQDSIAKLQTFLVEFSYQLAGIKKEFEKQNDETKTYAMERIDEITDYLNNAQEKLNNTVQSDIKNLENLVSSIADDIAKSLTGINEQFAEYSDTINNDLIGIVEGIKTNTDEINETVEGLKNSLPQHITIEDLEAQKEDLISKIELSLNMLNLFDFDDINKLKEDLTELNLNVNNKVAELLKTVSDKNDFKNLQKSIDELNLANILKRVDAINENIAVLKDLNSNFNLVNDKLDATLIPPMDYEDYTNKVDIIYENISILNNWTGKLDYINDTVEKLSARLDTVNRSVNVLNDKASELGEETEKETEQAEKIDIIYETLSLLNTWVMKIDTIDDNVSNISTWGFKIEEIKQKLENLSNEFAIITTATKDDTEEYIYTLLDIESDFAKLYCALDESHKSINSDINKLKTTFDGNYKLSIEDIEGIKKQFNALNEDISSISKRTNKLIINSDDSNKIFRGSLDEFSILIEDLKKKILLFNPSKQFSLIDNKVNTIKKLMAGSVSASQNLNEAFVYLAEWIDVTGKVINEIRDSVDLVKDSENDKTELIKTVFNDLQETITSQNAKIESLEAKLAHFENKIDSLDTLETKLSRILDKKLDEMSEIKHEDSSSEIKTILDFIASQVISANENSINNKALNQKIEIIEHQLTKFDKNLAKIVSYLDED